MKRLIKIVLTAIAALLLFTVLGFMGFFYFSDPNALKKRISDAVFEDTGYTIRIDGPLSWQLLPRIGIHAERVVINPDDRISTGSALAYIKNADISANLLQLLIGRICIDSISLSEPQIALIIRKDGSTNWLPANVPSTISSTTWLTDALLKSKPTKSSKIKVAHLNIEKATLFIDDKKTDFRVRLNELNLSVQRPSADAIFPFSTDFYYEHPSQHIFAHIQMKALVSYQPQTHRYALTGVTARVDDTTLSGETQYTESPKPQIQFKWHADALNLDRYLKMPLLPAKPNSVRQVVDELLDDDTESVKPIAPSESNPWLLLPISGSMQIEKLTFRRFTINQLKIPIEGHDGVIHFGPVTGHAYEGNIKQESVVDLRQPEPVWSGVKSGDQLQMEPLMVDLTGKPSIQGTMDYTSNFQATGSSLSTILQSLKGHANFTIKNGALTGLDFNQAIQAAVALFKQRPAPKINPEAQTKFLNLAFAVSINQTAFSISELVMNSPLFLATGKGQGDASNLSFDIRLLVSLIGAETPSPDAATLEQAAGGIPLRLLGTFDRFHLEPDKEAILFAIAKQTIKTKAEELMGVPSSHE